MSSIEIGAEASALLHAVGHVLSAVDKGSQADVQARVKEIHTKLENIKSLATKIDGNDRSEAQQIERIAQLNTQIELKEAAIVQATQKCREILTARGQELK